MDDLIGVAPCRNLHLGMYIDDTTEISPAKMQISWDVIGIIDEQIGI